MEVNSYDLTCKLLLVGDTGVGKTSLMLSYVDGVFTQSYISTIGIDYKVKTVEIDGKRIKVQIWDTAGQERYQTITTSYYRNAMGIVLVYDVCDRRTFENVSKWIDEITLFVSNCQEIVIVANKIDIEHSRIISMNDGFRVANNYKVKYAETSAKHRDTVDRLFLDMIKRIYDNNGCVSTVDNTITKLHHKKVVPKNCCKSP